jgi:hypothetical protein
MGTGLLLTRHAHSQQSTCQEGFAHTEINIQPADIKGKHKIQCEAISAVPPLVMNDGGINLGINRPVLRSWMCCGMPTT